MARNESLMQGLQTHPNPARIRQSRFARKKTDANTTHDHATAGRLLCGPRRRPSPPGTLHLLPVCTAGLLLCGPRRRPSPPEALDLLLVCIHCRSDW